MNDGFIYLSFAGGYLLTGGGQNKVHLAGMWPKQGEWQKRVPNEYNGGRIEPHLSLIHI